MFKRAARDDVVGSEIQRLWREVGRLQDLLAEATKELATVRQAAIAFVYRPCMPMDFAFGIKPEPMTAIEQLSAIQKHLGITVVREDGTPSRVVAKAKDNARPRKR